MSRFSTIRKKIRNRGYSLVSAEGVLIVPNVLVAETRKVGDKRFSNLNEVQAWVKKMFPVPKTQPKRNRGKKAL